MLSKGSRQWLYLWNSLLSFNGYYLILFPCHTPSWSISPNMLHFVHSIWASFAEEFASINLSTWAGFKDGQDDLLANTAFCSSNAIIPLYLPWEPQIICFYLDNCRCDSPLGNMRVWEFIPKRAIGQEFQEKLIFYIKPWWTFKACHIYSENTLLNTCVWPMWNANTQKLSFNICPTNDKVKNNLCHVLIPDFDLATCTVRARPTVGRESPSEHKKTSKCG